MKLNYYLHNLAEINDDILFTHSLIYIELKSKGTLQYFYSSNRNGSQEPLPQILITTS